MLDVRGGLAVSAINTFLDVSTAHITEQDANKLELDATGMDFRLPVLSMIDTGFILYNDMELILENAPKIGMSDAFIKLCRYAFFDMGVRWLVIRGCADEVSFLEKFNW